MLKTIPRTIEIEARTKLHEGIECQCFLQSTRSTLSPLYSEILEMASILASHDAIDRQFLDGAKTLEHNVDGDATK